MKLLLDKNLSFRLGGMLEAHGHDVVHVDDLGLGEADDDVILVAAREQGRIVVSSDTDFGWLLGSERAMSPSLILTRAIATLPSTEIARLLLEALEAAGDQLREGAIVAVGRENVRVRRLPIR